MKADLAICSSAIGGSGKGRSVSFMSSHYLDFSSYGLFQVFANQVISYFNMHMLALGMKTHVLDSSRLYQLTLCLRISAHFLAEYVLY